MESKNMESDMLPLVDQQLLEWIRSIRRTLHQYPELSSEEHRTSLFIQEKLTELGISYRNGWAGTGVIATLGCSSGQLPCSGHVGLRADMDALPINLHILFICVRN